MAARPLAGSRATGRWLPMPRTSAGESVALRAAAESSHIGDSPSRAPCPAPSAEGALARFVSSGQTPPEADASAPQHRASAATTTRTRDSRDRIMTGQCLAGPAPLGQVTGQGRGRLPGTGFPCGARLSGTGHAARARVRAQAHKEGAVKELQLPQACSAAVSAAQHAGKSRAGRLTRALAGGSASAARGTALHRQPDAPHRRRLPALHCCGWPGSLPPV